MKNGELDDQIPIPVNQVAYACGLDKEHTGRVLKGKRAVKQPHQARSKRAMIRHYIKMLHLMPAEVATSINMKDYKNGLERLHQDLCVGVPAGGDEQERETPDGRVPKGAAEAEGGDA